MEYNTPVVHEEDKSKQLHWSSRTNAKYITKKEFLKYARHSKKAANCTFASSLGV